MITSKFLRTALLTTALLCARLALPAQDTKAPSAKQHSEKKEGAKKPIAGPFHGKLKAMDKAAKTITVGNRTFHITSDTVINKAGKPATLNEAVIGEEVSGYVKPNDQGNLVATKLNIGPKVEPKAKKG
jgi:hypothetical protein